MTDRLEQPPAVEPVHSTPLKQRFLGAGVERRGIADLNQLTAASGIVDVETEYATVTHWTNAASDHGAVWVDLDI